MPAILLRTLLIVAIGFSCIIAADIKLVTFDNALTTTKFFRQTDDPVMGGRSTGTWTVDTENEFGVFDGDVVDVPFLRAPGFIKAQSANSKFPDISNCSSIVLNARSSTAYTGYRLSFSNKKDLLCSFFSSGFKTHFAAPMGSTFQDVVLPFVSFSNCNSDSTGEPKKLCKDDRSVCPDQKTLEDIETVSIWAEGADGKVHLEIKYISATGCNVSAAQANSTNASNEEDGGSRLLAAVCATLVVAVLAGIVVAVLVVKREKVKSLLKQAGGSRKEQKETEIIGSHALSSQVIGN